VTGSLIAVFERLDLATLSSLIASAADDPDIELITFQLQPAATKGTVPDGEISSGFRYLFEVKTEFDAIRELQLRGHLNNLSGTAADERLFVLTPDAVEPSAVATLRTTDPRLSWFSFATLSAAIDDVLLGEGIRDDERLLLRELQVLFTEEGLLGRQDTVVVAARLAYDFYLNHGAYVCQQARSFRADLSHLAFYRKRTIESEIPQILDVQDDVLFTLDEAARRRSTGNHHDAAIADLIEATLADGSRVVGDVHKVFLLSRKGDPETIELPAPVVHSGDGVGSAFTMGQRYVYLEDLRKAKTTADLR
jgi:hypothetical protein